MDFGSISSGDMAFSVSSSHSLNPLIIISFLMQKWVFLISSEYHSFLKNIQQKISRSHMAFIHRVKKCFFSSFSSPISVCGLLCRIVSGSGRIGSCGCGNSRSISSIRSCGFGSATVVTQTATTSLNSATTAGWSSSSSTHGCSIHGRIGGGPTLAICDRGRGFPGGGGPEAHRGLPVGGSAHTSGS